MRFKRLLHWAIVANLLLGFVGALYMVFVVHAMPGGIGPFGADVAGLDQDFFVRRRLYAIEAWICFGFLAIYLALTELRDRDVRSEGGPEPVE